MQLSQCVVPSPVGLITLVADDEALQVVAWGPHLEWLLKSRGPLRTVANHPVLLETARQLDAYFAGCLTDFSLPLRPLGTPFQQKAWQALQEIPFGEVLSYQEQARRLGNDRAARAVGAANGRNPLSIVVPCHRVVSRLGELTGYAGGLDAKRFLLQLEWSTRAQRLTA